LFNEIKAQLPPEAFGMDDEIQFNGDNYQLKLFFDQSALPHSTPGLNKDGNRCYQARIKVY
jgi:hypothetical protein